MHQPQGWGIRQQVPGIEHLELITNRSRNTSPRTGTSGE